MCKLIEDMVNERAERAVYKVKIEIAGYLIDRGEFSIEEIADITELSVDDVNELAKQAAPSLA